MQDLVIILPTHNRHDYKHIMAEEEDHEQDLQDYLNDIARMKAYILKK